jgi:DNA-binding CsgD family transcriptional regulator
MFMEKHLHLPIRDIERLPGGRFDTLQIRTESVADITSDYIQGIDRCYLHPRSEHRVLLVEVFASALIKLGFKYYSCHSWLAQENTNVSDVKKSIIYCLPNDELYNIACEIWGDGAITTLLKTHSPFLLSSIRPEHLIYSSAETLLIAAKTFGFSDVLILPILSFAGDITIVAIFVCYGSASKTSVCPEVQHAAYLIATHFHNHARSVLFEKLLLDEKNKRKTILSERENQVLGWTAKGKSSGEIGAILGISSKSVEFHLDGCKRKLNVFNKAHAVAKALLFGVLTLSPGFGDDIMRSDRVELVANSYIDPKAILTKP